MPNLGDTYNILIKTSADDSGINKAKSSLQGLNEESGRSSKLAGAASIAHTAFGVAAGFALDQAAFKAVAFGKSVVSSFEDSQNQIAQTNAVLASTKGVAGVTAAEVDQLSKSWEHQTRFSDEAVRSAENMLLTFTNIHQNVFPETTKAVIDMSTAMHQDLQTTSIQVGKALQDPVLGATALQRVGVRLTQSQKDTIKSMVALGNTAGAQKVILKELTNEFGGSATAAGHTFAGSIDRLKNRWDDMKENMGLFLVNEGMKTFQWFQSVRPVLQEVWDKVANFLSPSITALRAEFEKFMPTAKILFNDVLKPAAIIIGGLVVASVWVLINVLNILMRALQDLVQWVRNISGAFASAWGYIVGVWQGAVGFFYGLIGGIKGAFGGIASSISAPFRGAFNLIADAWNNTVGRLHFTVPNWVPGMGGKGWNAPSLPHFAMGVQNFGGGMALVGERGPEVVSLPQGSNVYSNGQSRQMMSNISNNKNVSIGTVVLNSGAAVDNFLKSIDQDRLLLSKGLTPRAF